MSLTWAIPQNIHTLGVHNVSHGVNKHDVEDGTVPLRKYMCLHTGRKVVKQGRVEQYLVLYEDYMLLYTMAYVLKEILLHFTNHLRGNMMLVKHMHQDIVKGRD